MPNRAIGAVLHPVAAAIARLALPPDSLILATLSGGPDSVAMLHALATLRTHHGFKLEVAHLNHRLRGAEADRDEAFVRELCARLGLALVVGRTRNLATTTANLEERARDTRHNFLLRLANQRHASFIALAHQADDQAETVLMRLLRGAGAAGLAAMAECGPGRLWRPLLAVKRSAILAYLDAIGATWVTDSTNASSAILRNRIRLDLLPMLEREFAPGLSTRLTELADEMRALDDYVSRAAQAELTRRLDGPRLGIEGFPQLHPALAGALLREFIRERLGSLRHLSRDHVETMRELCHQTNPSGSVVLPGGWHLRREYGFVRLERTDASNRTPSSTPRRVRLKESGMTRVSCCGFTFRSRLTGPTSDESIALPCDTTEAIFDVDQLEGALDVRVVRPGDRLAPHGLSGSRKVQDLFVDHKLPRRLRAAWPLVVAGEQIVWIPGIARSRTALVTSASKKVRHLRAFSSAWRE